MTRLQLSILKLINAVTLVGLSTNALSQTSPDAGTLLRETERAQSRRLPPVVPQGVPADPAASSAADVRIHVKAFRITGNTLIAGPELQAVLAPWVGKESSFTELQQAVNAIAEEYKKRSWFARPQLPAQDVNDGIIEINIIEGRLGAVHIDDQGKELRIEREFVTESMTARQKPGDILSLELLDRSTNLLNDTPGVAVATILAPGKNPGESDAVVKVQDKSLISGTLQWDNQGARSTGEQKATLSTGLDNPTGIGDQISLNTSNSQGSQYLKLGYSLPIGHDGLRVGASSSAMTYQLIGDMASSKSKGDAQTYGINAFYPLLRQATKNLSLSAAVDRKDYYNEASSAVTSVKQLHTGILSLSGDMLDGLGAGGMSLGSLNLTLGDVDLGGNLTNANADATGPRTAGSYHKIGYSLSRLQRLSDKATLWATVNGQVARKNLDSSEKLSLGGPSGVRAYPVIEASGDEGWQATLEARYNVMPELQLAAFYDHGRIKQAHDANYGSGPAINIVSLKGTGLSVAWSQPGNYSLRAVWARRSGWNPLQNAQTAKDTDGSYDRTRLWMTIVKFF